MIIMLMIMMMLLAIASTHLLQWERQVIDEKTL
jgi:hypothetical protein